MRINLLLPLLALATLSQAQVWEKRIAPGLTYREEVDRSIPRVIHVLRWSAISPDVYGTVELGAGTIFDQTPRKGRATVRQIAQRTKAIAAVNGDYFISSNRGDPVGLAIVDGQIVSTPIVKRAALGWEKGIPKFGMPTWTGELDFEGRKVTIDGMNEQPGPNRVVLDTEAAGFALGTQPEIAVILEMDPGVWRADGTRTGRVQEIVRDLAGRNLGKDRAAILATGSRMAEVSAMSVGQTVQISSRGIGFDWNTIRYACGGGPMLVTDGKVSVDWQEEFFKPTLALPRHPRTAIGVTPDGDVLLVAIDGRENGISMGASLEELGRIMLRLGCREAMNLDGGGSTTMVVDDLVLNRPSDGEEKAVAEAVALHEAGQSDLDQPKPKLILKAPERFKVGENRSVDITADGAIPDNANVIWSASGAAWIDQGGTLHATQPGKCLVRAYCEGSLVSATVTVEPKTAPRTSPAPSSHRRRARRASRP